MAADLDPYPDNKGSPQSEGRSAAPVLFTLRLADPYLESEDSKTKQIEKRDLRALQSAHTDGNWAAVGVDADSDFGTETMSTRTTAGLLGAAPGIASLLPSCSMSMRQSLSQKAR